MVVAIGTTTMATVEAATVTMTTSVVETEEAFVAGV
jgi:hypothetical protein